jgi:hypothetical protein
MSQLGIQILSSVEYEDNNFDHNNSVFVADGRTYNNSMIYHVPGTILFKDYVNGSWVTNPINKILNTLSSNRLGRRSTSSSRFCKIRCVQWDSY